MKVNVVKKSRLLYFDSNSDLSNLNKRSYVKIDDENYKIEKYKKVTKNFKYDTIDSNIIELPREAYAFLMRGDIIKIYVPSYYLDTILSIKDKSGECQVGDIIEIRDGVTASPAILMVTATDENNNIAMLDIQSSGKYLSEPLEFSVFNTNKNKEIDINIETVFRTLEKQEYEVIIKTINANAKHTIIRIDGNILPFNCSNDVYFEKYAVIIDREFPFSTQIEKECEIHSNFSPYLELPFAEPNTPSLYSLYNELVEKVDAELKRLNDMVNKN